MLCENSTIEENYDYSLDSEASEEDDDEAEE